MDLRVVEDLVHRHTDGRVKDLEVELRPDRVVLRGRTESYYIKQLAQHDLRRLLPAECALDNLIVVRSATDNPLRYFDLFPAREPIFVGRSLTVPAAVNVF